MNQTTLILVVNRDGSHRMAVVTSRDEAKRVMEAIVSAHPPEFFGSHNVKTSTPDHWFIRSADIVLAFTVSEEQMRAAQMGQGQVQIPPGQSGNQGMQWR